MKEAKTTGELMIDPLGMGQCGLVWGSQGYQCQPGSNLYCFKRKWNQDRCQRIKKDRKGNSQAHLLAIMNPNNLLLADV